MNSGNESKYLTPCRSFGLKRIHKKTPRTPGSSESGAYNSAASRFTSPVTFTGATVPSVEKRCSSLQDSLWSPTLINKTGLKMGLSKPSGKQKTARILKPKNSLNGTPSESTGETRDTVTPKASLGKCLDGRVVPKTLLGRWVGITPKPIISKHPSGDVTPRTLLGNSPNVDASHNSLLAECPERNSIRSLETPKTLQEKCPDVDITHKSMPVLCHSGVASPSSSFDEDSGIGTITKTSSRKCTDEGTSPTIYHEKSLLNTIKNGFIGWDSDSKESTIANSALTNFKIFLDNQMIMTRAFSPCPSSQNSSCHTDLIADATASSENATVISNAASLNRNFLLTGNSDEFHENSDTVINLEDCNSHSKSVHENEPQAVSKESDDYYKEKSPTLEFVEDEDGRCVSHRTKLSDNEMDDEIGSLGFASTHPSNRKTCSRKQDGNGKLSLKKQCAMRYSERHAVNKICSHPPAVGQETTDDQVITGVEGEAVNCKSDTEEVEQLERDIQKWLEGGQRVIQEIIEEVQRQKDREMTVMEVLEEQGVDPDLVGYDPQREEFITFHQFMLKNGIS